MTAKLVVDLPAHNTGVVRKAVGQRRDDPSSLPAVGRGVETVMAPATEFANRSVGGSLPNVRMGVDEPLRGGGRRRAENRRQAPVVGQIDHVGEPVEGNLAGFGFQARPGELAHSDVFEPRIGHLVDVRRPAIPRPVLGEITDADRHARRCRRGVA